MKKPNSGRKNTRNTGKKAVKKEKTVKKRSKTGSAAVQSFLVVVLLVALSVFISIIIIIFNTNQSSEPDNTVTEAPPVEPAVTTPVQNPVQDSNTVQPDITSPVSATGSSSSGTGSSATGSTAPSSTTSTSTSVSTAKPIEKPVENLGSLVFVIDDAGNNLRELDPFLRITDPLTIAVLPGLPYSAESARRIRAAGKEVILHQPMEAIGAQNPGPGAIYSGMSADEIREVLSKNLAEVGPVAGINNHQGSKITMDKEAMETILSFCAEHKIFFLDSRTTAETTVPAVARQLGLKIAERDIFIDNEQDKDAMLRYITEGLAKARKNGHAVMIGHTWSPDLAPLLAEKIPLLTSQGYTIKTASEVIK